MISRSGSLILVSALVAGLAASPVGAHLLDTHDGGGGAGSGADLHTRNVKLLANVGPSGFTNSDLAFWGGVAVAGNYGGFRVLDVSDPENPTVLASVPCNGAQGDVSIWGTLVFVSVDTPQTTPGCDSANTTHAATPGAWEGVRIFDITNPFAPRLVTSVYTICGSHTHTLVPDPENDRVFVYVSSYALTTGSLGGGCNDVSRGDHKQISIIEVPLERPEDAVARTHPLHPDTLALHGPAVIPEAAAILLDTTGCHDITVFMEIRRAAAACLAEGQIWDISDPASPVTLRRIVNPHVDVWHSSAFSWDGRVVAFGDEWQGASSVSRGFGCRGQVDSFLGGRIWFYELDNPATPRGSFTIPRPQEGICTAHNFNFVPGARGYLLVSAFYIGGTSVIDATDLANAREIGFYAAKQPIVANTWSSYWYNNFIFTNDIARGVDVYLVTGPARAGAKRLQFLNPQTQMSLVR